VYALCRYPEFDQGGFGRVHHGSGSADEELKAAVAARKMAREHLPDHPGHLLGKTLAIGATCALRLKVQPSAIGPRSATLEILSNDRPRRFASR
jgi:hypothetical protein